MSTLETNTSPKVGTIEVKNLSSDVEEQRESIPFETENDIKESNNFESQDHASIKDTNVAKLEIENDEDVRLGDKNRSPSMLNELAEAIIADNFESLSSKAIIESLKDEKQNTGETNISSSKILINVK